MGPSKQLQLGAMSEPPLDVQPTELAFKVVPDAYSTKQLRLFNRGSKPMAFKIKTTNPKQYFVRPNQGIVKAGEKIVIHVMMGKVHEVPKEKCKDRFLVQSAVYDGELPNDKFEWKSHFTDASHKPDEIKLKCSYITQSETEEPGTKPSRPTTSDAVDSGLHKVNQGKPATTTKVDAKPSSPVKTASSEKIMPMNPPTQAKGPGYTMWLVIAIMFFLVGRYTTHVAIPGLE